jgi:hypothetical protein
MGYDQATKFWYSNVISKLVTWGRLYKKVIKVNYD